MRIVQHLSILLFFLFMNGFFGINVSAASISLSGSVLITENQIENETENETENEYEEKLSFDTNEKSVEIDLKSANDINDEDKTIKELEDEKDQLITEKKIITKNFNTFILNNGDLKKYFKHDLKPSELSIIEQIVIRYNLQRLQGTTLSVNRAVELEGSPLITKDLLLLKKDLYVSFLPFIQVPLLEDYKSFVKADATATKKDKNLQSDIYKKEKIVEEKKIVIQEKINESEQSLEIKKNQVIEGKINQKLLSYSNGKKFNSLDLSTKKNVFNSVLDKISERRINLESSFQGKNEELSKKIGLYIVVETALTNFIRDLK